VIAQEPEMTALRKDGRIIVDRSILKVKDQATRYTIATDILDQVTIGYGFTLKRPQSQETMNKTFLVANGNLSTRRCSEEAY
jgi:hypothetical protein